MPSDQSEKVGRTGNMEPRKGQNSKVAAPTITPARRSISLSSSGQNSSSSSSSSSSFPSSSSLPPLSAAVPANRTHRDSLDSFSSNVPSVGSRPPSSNPPPPPAYNSITSSAQTSLSTEDFHTSARSRHSISNGNHSSFAFEASQGGDKSVHSTSVPVEVKPTTPRTQNEPYSPYPNFGQAPSASMSSVGTASSTVTPGSGRSTSKSHMERSEILFKLGTRQVLKQKLQSLMRAREDMQPDVQQPELCKASLEKTRNIPPFSDRLESQRLKQAERELQVEFGRRVQEVEDMERSRPKINSSSRTMQRGPEILQEWYSRVCASHREAELLQEKRTLEEFTGHPSIDPKSRAMASTRRRKGVAVEDLLLTSQAAKRRSMALEESRRSASTPRAVTPCPRADALFKMGTDQQRAKRTASPPPPERSQSMSRSKSKPRDLGAPIYDALIMYGEAQKKRLELARKEQHVRDMAECQKRPSSPLPNRSREELESRLFKPLRSLSPRARREEEARIKQMTFHPSINETSLQLSSERSMVPAIDRLLQSKDVFESEMIAKRAQKERMELSECSFTPDIRSGSPKIGLPLGASDIYLSSHRGSFSSTGPISPRDNGSNVDYRLNRGRRGSEEAQRPPPRVVTPPVQKSVPLAMSTKKMKVDACQPRPKTDPNHQPRPRQPVDLPLTPVSSQDPSQFKTIPDMIEQTGSSVPVPQDQREEHKHDQKGHSFHEMPTLPTMRLVAPSCQTRQQQSQCYNSQVGCQLKNSNPEERAEAQEGVLERPFFSNRPIPDHSPRLPQDRYPLPLSATADDLRLADLGEGQELLPDQRIEIVETPESSSSQSSPSSSSSSSSSAQVPAPSHVSEVMLAPQVAPAKEMGDRRANNGRGVTFQDLPPPVPCQEEKQREESDEPRPVELDNAEELSSELDPEMELLIQHLTQV